MVDLSTVGVPRACGVRFDQFLKCLSRNPTDIGSCQAEYSALSECAAERRCPRGMLLFFFFFFFFIFTSSSFFDIARHFFFL
jgi:hypothetical protein